MTKWALLLGVIYTLASEPDGQWTYRQVFGWFDSELTCKAMAEKEARDAVEFSSPFRDMNPWLPRSMILKKMTYDCITENELIERMKNDN